MTGLGERVPARSLEVGLGSSRGSLAGLLTLCLLLFFDIPLLPDPFSGFDFLFLFLLAWAPSDMRFSEPLGVFSPEELK